MRAFLIILIVLSFSIRVNAQWGILYRTGYYYDTSGQKIAGLIGLEPSRNYLYFKADNGAKYKKIHVKDIDSVIIMHGDYGSNEIIPVLNEGDKPNRRYFAIHAFTSPNTIFYYKYISKTYGGTASLTTLSNVGSSTSNGLHSVSILSTSPSESYSGRVIMYSNGSTTYEITKSNYIKVLSNSFINDPKLVARLKNKEFSFKRLDEIFKQYRSDIFHAEPETIKLDSNGLVK